MHRNTKAMAFSEYIDSPYMFKIYPQKQKSLLEVLPDVADLKGGRELMCKLGGYVALVWENVWAWASVGFTNFPVGLPMQAGSFKHPLMGCAD